MSIEELKTMKTQLMSCVQGQMGNLKDTDTKELGQAIDMLKDLSEAIYYCTITEAMEKADEVKDRETPVNNITYYTSPTPAITPVNYFTEPMPMYDKMYPDYYRDMERNGGYMYYPNGRSGNNNGGRNGSNNSTGSRSGATAYYTEMPYIERDPREGKAAMRRRMYMEGKEMHNDTHSQLRELEAYLKQLSSDITEMIKDSSPEEKATLRQNMTMLANKIA